MSLGSTQRICTGGRPPCIATVPPKTSSFLLCDFNLSIRSSTYVYTHVVDFTGPGSAKHTYRQRAVNDHTLTTDVRIVITVPFTLNYSIIIIERNLTAQLCYKIKEL